jgi:hypothetical protein
MLSPTVFHHDQDAAMAAAGLDVATQGPVDNHHLNLVPSLSVARAPAMNKALTPYDT